MKGLMALAFTLGVLAFSANNSYAATALAYYSFNSPWGTGSLTSPIESPEFIVNNTYGVVTIKGWQDTPYSGTPNVSYDLMKSETFIDSQIGRATFRGIYPKNGTWYSHTFTGAIAGFEYYIKMYPNSSTGMNGAGNAYYGY